MDWFGVQIYIKWIKQAIKVCQNAQSTSLLSE